MAMAFRGVGNGGILPGDRNDFPQYPAPEPVAQKFGAWDAAGLLGDALQSFGGGKGTYAPVLMAQGQRRQELQDAAAQRQAQVQDWIFKQQYEAANPGPSPLSRDVAAFQNLTPEQRKAYGEMQDLKAGPTTVSLPNGFVYSGSRTGLGEALGGAGQPATQPTIQDTPAPTMGANGNPQFLTPEQYLAVEKSMGPEKTAAWAQRNRIPIAKSVNGVTAYQIGGKWYDNPEGR